MFVAAEVPLDVSFPAAAARFANLALGATVERDREPPMMGTSDGRQRSLGMANPHIGESGRIAS